MDGWNAHGKIGAALLAFAESPYSPSKVCAPIGAFSVCSSVLLFKTNRIQVTGSTVSQTGDNRSARIVDPVEELESEQSFDSFEFGPEWLYEIGG